jgi:N-acetylglucosamine kinase-like BadF-type ATPase
LTVPASDAPSGDGLVLAVDGGGAKTDLALLDGNGSLLSHVRGGRSQVYYLGVDGCVEVLEGLLETAATRAGRNPLERPLASTAQLLLAGLDLPEELSALRGAIERLHWSERLVVGNDTEAVLRAGTDRGWGIAVVCGTGINCLGLAPDGRKARFLSFGSVSGDWGGGGDVGLAALAAATRAADGRGPRSALETEVPNHFGLSDRARAAPRPRSARSATPRRRRSVPARAPRARSARSRSALRSAGEAIAAVIGSRSRSRNEVNLAILGSYPHPPFV